jgi:hypothetical protein
MQECDAYVPSKPPSKKYQADQCGTGGSVSGASGKSGNILDRSYRIQFDSTLNFHGISLPCRASIGVCQQSAMEFHT